MVADDSGGGVGMTYTERQRLREIGHWFIAFILVGGAVIGFSFLMADLMRPPEIGTVEYIGSHGNARLYKMYDGRRWVYFNDRNGDVEWRELHGRVMRRQSTQGQ
jgi:hypothetical protein